MRRWGIILGSQLMFETDDEDVAQRFMALIDQGFQVIDHSTGYYAYVDNTGSRNRDLIKHEITAGAP